MSESRLSVLTVVTLAGAAVLAADAFGAVDAGLGLQLPAFGVAAPAAAQRTPFEEQLGAHARPVMDGEALDVEDDPAFRHGGGLLYCEIFHFPG